MDFVFICPPSFKQKKFEKTIGLAYIQAYLKEKGIESIQYIPSSSKLEEIVKEIINLNPKVVGFSCYDANFYYVNLLCKKIKEQNNKIITVVGGPTATFSSDLILSNCPHIDYCSRGYGEIVNYNFFKSILENKNVKNIKGISFRENGKVINNPLQSLPENMDDLPSPYLTDINYDSPRKLVFTSRGCIYNCVYCNCSIMSNKQIHFFSIDRIIEELKYIDKHFPNSYVQIGDDAFTLNLERAKTICRKIIESKLTIKLFCETRVDRLDDELISLLKQANFVKTDFGLESANLKVLREIKKVRFKPFDEKNDDFSEEKAFLTKMSENIEKCRKMNLDPMVNIITGLPTETISEAKETLKFIKKLKLNSYSHNYLRFYSGTELFNNYEKYGYKIKRNAFLLPIEVNHPINVEKVLPLSNAVSRNEVVRLKNRIKNVLVNKDLLIKLDDFSCKSKVKDLKDIDLNKELFIYLKKESEKDIIIKNIVKNDIPTNNLVFLIDKKDKIVCYSILDKENKVIIHKANEKLKLTKKYYEFLLVENLSEELKLKFKEININPYLNKTILLFDDKQDINIKNIAEDYCNSYKNSDIKIKLLNILNLLNYDLTNNILINAQKLLKEKKIFKQDMKILVKFLHYYLMGEIV